MGATTPGTKTPSAHSSHKIIRHPKPARRLSFYKDPAAYIAALELNQDYQTDKGQLLGAPFFPSETAEQNKRFLQAQHIRLKMKAAHIPSYGKWHLAEAVQTVPVRRREDGKSVTLTYLRDKRRITLRINPNADKETILREAWNRIKRYQRRGNNKNPLISAAQLEVDGSIIIEVDTSSTKSSFEKRLWAAIRSLRPRRASRLRRGHSDGHFSSPLDDIAVLRSIEKKNLHAQAKERCQSTERSVEDDGVDRTLQSLKRARDRAKRLIQEVYPRS